jgi:TonB-linked SusC/RagA family outer membrane protein
MNSKQIPRLVAMGLAILVIVNLSPIKAFGQSDSKIMMASISEQSNKTTVLSVKNFLTQLENNYQVNFFYQHHVIKDKFINVGDNFLQKYDKKTDGEVVAELLTRMGIEYDRLNEQTYILFQDKADQNKFVQVEQITGTVTDASSGESLPGVNIAVKGTTTGTSTDSEGNYELTVPSLQDTLVYSFIGYESQTVAINGRTTINIELESSVYSGEEMVVVGYGTQQKSDLTGSVSSVSVDELNQGVSSSVDQMLVGKSAGVSVVQSSGAPGGGSSINIRGAGSVNASNSPLYVIDGVPIDNNRNIQGSGTGIGSSRTSRSPLASLNPEDIESIEILKDASATAIYGSRGANGVVLITTKGGRSGSLQVDYHGYAGIQNMSNKLDVLSPDEYRNVLNNIIDAGGESEEFRVGEINNRTDWQDEINNANALVQNQQIAFSGGNETNTYYISLNYMDQEGIVKSSNFNRYSARVNIDSKISDRFDVGLNLTTSYSKDNFAPQGAGINENGGAIYASQMFDPTLPIQESDGNYAISPSISIDNPVALLNGVDSNSNTNRTFGSVKAEYDFTENFYAKVNIGGDFTNETRKTFISQITKRGRQQGGLGTLQDNQSSNYLIEGTLHYNQTLGSHSINALAGVSYQRFITENAFERAENFPSDATGADNLGLGDQSTYELNTSKFGHRLGSYIGRLNYTLQDKYLLTSTLRVDGSSRFGENNRFSVFPSFALGWKLKEESFLEDVQFLSSLKLRTSWGQSGNQSIGNYPSIATYQQGTVAIWDDERKVTATPARVPNPNLKWETTEQINLGLDFGFLEERITGSLNYYRKKTTDMLLNLPIPTSSGFATKLSNVGSILNNGFEFSLNSTNVSAHDFAWSSSLTASTTQNEVEDIGRLSEIIVGGASFFAGNPAIIRPGSPLNSFYGYKIEGIWQEDDDFSSTTDNVQPGSIKFRDQNGDGTVNEEDRVLLGDSFPDLSLSLGNTFNYKNLEFFIFIDAVQGIEMLNANKVETYYPVNFRRNKYAEPYLNRWTPENPSNTYPSFVNTFSQGAKPINSYTVEDASYIKLRTVRLSFDLPKFTPALRNATIYVTGENLFTITGYDGYDPAVNPRGNANYRIDLNAYPSARTFMLGLKLGL